MHRIVLIHATHVAIAPIEAALARLWPEAQAQGEDIAMPYTFPPALEERREFRDDVAARRGRARLRAVFVPDALDALKAGDPGRHEVPIASAAAAIGAAEAIMLAQVSMASAGQDDDLKTTFGAI